MRKPKNKPTTMVEIIRRQRGDWGNVNPVTKIIPDKRRKPPKYKGKWDE